MKLFRKSVLLISSAAALMLSLTFSTNPYTDSRMAQLIAKANNYYLKFPQEKVYLHLDKSSYWASDDIWFKAYLKDSPTPNCNLYVELLNSSGYVIQKKMFWAQGGLAYGDFHLTDTISTGVYQVRAYTNWMRNFDEGWFFRKDLVIWSLKDQEIDEDKRQLRENKIDIQFFPEGGTFIYGLKSKVAFKAADRNGKGLDVEGRIVDDLDKVVADFASNFNGLGNFILQPKEGRKYQAQVTVAGQIEMRVDLPTPQAEGVAMAVNHHNVSQLHIQINKKSIAPVYNSATEYILLGQSKGFVYYRKNISLGKETFDLDIEKEELPTGIVQFTLFDKDVIPVCERLIFNNHHENVNIEIEPDKERYREREHVKLQISSTDGEIPIMANLSISVFNTDAQLQKEDYPNNILTHFLLGAELKGTIENPGWYFKNDSLSTVLALDNLMLTHGYRHFEWKEISEDHYPKIEYPSEECIQVRGTVKSILLEKPIPDSRVTMVSLKGLFRFYQVSTDSLGKFLFSNLYFNDSIPFSIQAINKKGKRNTEIELNNLSNVSPQVQYLPLNYQYIGENFSNSSTYLSELPKDLINRKWHLSDTILLGDINIVKHKIKGGDGHIRMYGEADYVFDIAKQDNVYGNIIDMLEVSTLRRFIGGAFFLDGAPVSPDLIKSLPASGFDKVEVVKFSPLIKGGGPGVFFYLKRGEQQKYISKDALGMKSTTIIGYSVIRQFYSPKYESDLKPEMKDDYRSTLYWNPVLRTDSLGRAAVSFYNSDQAGEVQVVVEGVTADGKLCRGVAKYKVTQ